MSRAPLLAAVALAACLPRTSPFTRCVHDSDCAAAGANAQCEADGACALPDQSCSSGYAYAGSAPSPGTCTGASPGTVDAPPGTADTMPGTPDGKPSWPARADGECIPGGPLPMGYSTCADKVRGAEPRCGTEMWDELCVHRAEVMCSIECAQMAFVGTDGPAYVLRTSDHMVLWTSSDTDADGAGAWADYDNDGYPDLAVVSRHVFYVFHNDGYDGKTLTLSQTSRYDWQTLEPGDGFTGQAVAWVDYDNDGDLDAVFAGYSGLFVLRNDGGAFTPQAVPLLDTPESTTGDRAMISFMAWGDYDGDGYPDVALSRYGLSAQVFHNETAKETATPRNGTIKDSGWTPSEAAEFGRGIEWCNLDGAVDPQPELAYSGTSYVVIADNDKGTMVNTVHVLDSSDDTSDLQCADLDGDGKLDLVVSGFKSPSRAYTSGGTLASFSETWRDSSPVAGLQPWGVGLADLDGDHKLDLVVIGDWINDPVQWQTFSNTSTSSVAKFSSSPTAASLPALANSAGQIKFAPLATH